MRYDPRGVFGTFQNYNVEVRDRVKCISAIDGVPVSIQWEPLGYYYPTQIAQFGLAHYSKNLTEPEPRRKVIDDSESVLAAWTESKGSVIARIKDSSKYSEVLQFSTADQTSNHVFIKLNHVLDFILSFDVQLQYNSSIIIGLKNQEKNEVYYLHYIPSDVMISSQVLYIYTSLFIQMIHPDKGLQTRACPQYFSIQICEFE